MGKLQPFPEKSHPALSQQPPLKVEVLSSPPPFSKIWLEAQPPPLQKGGVPTMVYYNNNKCFLVLVIYISLLCFVFFFFKKQKIIDLKKSSWQKFCNIIFLFLLKIGLGRPIDEQINLFLPKGT